MGIEFGKLLRATRNSLALTQRQLAERTGLDATSVTRYEQGQRRPSRSAIESLAGSLGLSGRQEEDFMIAANHAPQRLIEQAGRVEPSRRRGGLGMLDRVLNRHDLSLAEKETVENQVVGAVVRTLFQLKGSRGVEIVDDGWMQITGRPYFRSGSGR